MKYTAGGIRLQVGSAYDIELPVAAPPPPKETKPPPPPPPPDDAPPPPDDAPPIVEPGDENAPPPDAPPDAPPENARLRLSTWLGTMANALGNLSKDTGWKLVRDDRIESKYKGNLDDISAVATLCWKDGGNVGWSPGCLPGYPEATRIDLCKEAVDKLHASGVQLIAGYEYVDGISAGSQGGGKFAAWLAGASEDTLAKYADDLMAFLYDKIGCDWDGVGFDIELHALKASHADQFVKFYHLLADRLEGKGSKCLTIATGLSPRLEGGKVIISEKATMGTNLAQPFSTALGKKNIIIRPMAYDGGDPWHGRLRAWHEALIDHALNVVGLQPSQFQLGVKVIKNSVQWQSAQACTITDPNQVAQWGREVLRPRKVGLITFAGSGHPATYNGGLNEGMAPGGTVGQPLQVPLGKALA